MPRVPPGRSRPLRNAASLLLAACLAGPNVCSGIESEDPIEKIRRMYDDAPFRLGPFKASPELFLNNAGVDDNVWGAYEDPIRDFTFTAGGGGTLFLRAGHRVLLSVHETPSYVYFNETEQLRGWNNALTVRQHVALNRFLVTFTEAASIVRERYSSEMDAPPRHKENAIEGSVLWLTAQRTSLEIRGRGTQIRYTDEDFEGQNLDTLLSRDETLVAGRLYYQLFPKTKLFVEGEGVRYAFRDDPEARDSRSRGLYAGFEFSPEATLSGAVRLGYESFEPLDPAAKSYDGIAGEAKIAYRFMSRFVARGLFSRNPYFSVYSDNTYFLETRAGIGGTVYLLRGLRIEYDYTRGENSYPEEPSPENRVDRYYINQFRLAYRLRRHWDLGLSVYQWSRDSTVTDLGDNRTTWGFNLAYAGK
ncbi:MAG: outer membrane beta-barrel protein [Acidobacteriota bacterium]